MSPAMQRAWMEPRDEFTNADGPADSRAERIFPSSPLCTAVTRLVRLKVTPQSECGIAAPCDATVCAGVPGWTEPYREAFCEVGAVDVGRQA